MMTGALTPKTNSADVMTPVGSMFTLSINDKLDQVALGHFKPAFADSPSWRRRERCCRHDFDKRSHYD